MGGGRRGRTGTACVRHNKLAQVWPKRFVAISLLVRRCLLLLVPLLPPTYKWREIEKQSSNRKTEREGRKRKKFAAYAFITFFALAARVQKTLPGLVPSEMETTTTTTTLETMAGWITGTGSGTGSGSGSTPGGHISCARPHKLFKTCVPSVWLGVL